MAVKKASAKTKKTESRKKRLEGKVVSNKMEKTVIVRVSRKSAHPVYKKVMKSAKKFPAHTEEKLEIGDKVIIEESRPYSKTKRFIVVEKIEKK